MAEQVLRLFPSASLRRNGPDRLCYADKPHSEPDFEMVKPLSDGKGMTTAAVVITITEASPTRFTHDIIQEPPRAHLADDNSRAISPSPSNIELPLSPSDSRADTPAPAEGLPILQTSSPVLDCNENTSPTSVHSPVMRSMFPRFDPAIPLQQQRYYPTIERGPSRIPDAAITRAEYPPSCYSPSENIPIPKASYIHPNTPNKPTTISPVPPPPEPRPEFSSPSDLLSLWSLANGQGLDNRTSTYTLQLECSSLAPSLESIHLLSSLSTPLYSLTASASSTSHIITRTHPTTPHPTPLTIAQPTLLPLGPSQPLLASIFPAMAELMALDQSSSVAVAYKLDRATSGELQAEALVRAKAREGCELFWDGDSGRYYLLHPTLGGGEPSSLEIAVEHDPRTGELSHIRIRAPSVASPLAASPSSATTTHSPVLMTLSLSTLALTINAPLIAALSSLYILDSLLSALLTLLLHLHRSASDSQTTNPFHPHPHSPSSARSLHSRRHDSLLSTTTTMTFAPPPTAASPGAKAKAKAKAKAISTRSVKTSRFGKARRKSDATTVDYRNSNNNGNSEMQGEGDIEMGIIPSSHHYPEQQQHTPVSTIPTFKPTFDVDDFTLPKPTRAMLRLLYWGFAGAVWTLGVVVNLLAAGVVGLGVLVRKL